MVRLLVSPVVPPLLGPTHVGAELDPSVNATFTVIDEPELKSARDPPALPTTLNSVSVQPFAISELESAVDEL